MLQQYPIEELKDLRGPAAVSLSSVAVGPGNRDLGVKSGVVKTSEVVAVFALPKTAGSFGVSIGKSGPAPPPTPGNTPIGLRMCARRLL